MSTNLRTIVFGLGFATLGAVTVIGTQAFAQQGRGPGSGAAHAQRTRGGPGGGMGQIAVIIADLDLSEDQQVLAQELRAELRDQAEGHREDRDADRDSIMEALESDPVDAETIHALIDQRQARKLEVSHAFADAAITFFDSLDGEQQAVVLDRADRSMSRPGRMRQAMQEPAAEK